jgi:hypothetical protein
MVIHAEMLQNAGVDRVTLIVLLACGLVALLLATRLRRTLPPPAPPENILRVDLDQRD